MNAPFIIIVIAILLCLFLVLYVVVKQSRRKGLSPKEMQYIRSHWIRIIDMFNGNPAQSIIDSDKLLDYGLKVHGFEGTLGEKLKKAGPRFSDLNGVWAAHKLRNRAAHELSGINKDEAKRALSGFKRALNDLGAGL